MARFITRIADLCRHRAAEELFLRRFRMMQPGEDREDCGPGWYESSRELELGLQVQEGRPGDSLLSAMHTASTISQAGWKLPSAAGLFGGGWAMQPSGMTISMALNMPSLRTMVGSIAVMHWVIT